ncbi:MAG: DUF2341 domain-containing protein [Candidatus Omnitrophica bacterium]|nr:DUF2341 domain-containing protein [Candidatus Omnitrophota bacterium]
MNTLSRIILVFLFPILFFVFFPLQSVYAGDMSAWSTEVSVDIDNTSNTNNLTDYSVLVVLNTQSLIAGGSMESDGRDIRFTAAQNDDTTFLDYWMETDTVDTTSTRLWVQVGNIPASSHRTIYIYYGNSGAAAYSDPDATFIEFINFNTDGVLSYGGGQDAQPAQYEILDSGRTLRMYGNNWKASNTSLTLGGQQKLDFSFKNAGAQAEINGVGLDINSTDLNSNWFYKADGTQSWGSYSTSPVYSGSGDYERLGTVLDDFSGNFSYLVFSNDADAGQATNVYYRDVRVRKYSSPEPTATILLPITRINFTTTARTTYQSVVSSAITVETQDETVSAQKVSSDTTILLNSASATGEFSLTEDPFISIASVTIAAGFSQASFYCRDSTTGTHALTASENPDQGWTDGAQDMTIEDLGLGTDSATVVVDNSACGPQTNYQVLITLNTQALISQGKMQADGDDIRILDSDNTTPLNYWIQTGTVNSTSTRIWVKVPGIPALSTKSLYLYYNNALAGPFSSGETTFDHFVNFGDDGVISYGAGQDVQPSHYGVQDGGQTLHVWGNNWKATNFSLTLDGSQRIDLSFKNSGTQAEINGLGLDTEINGLNANWFYKADGTQAWGLYSTTPVYSGSDGFEDLSVILDDFSGSFSYLVLANDADAGQPTDVYYRDVRVRKNSVCEPSTNVEMPIHQIVFTSAGQTVLEDRASSLITVETQDEISGAQVVSCDSVIELSSTSLDGQFSLTSSPFNPILSVTILAGSSSASFYYRDSAVGVHTLTAAENPSRGWTDGQQVITVEQIELIGDYRMKMTVDNSACPDAKTDFQVLVMLDTQTLVANTKMNADGSDIRFVADDEITELSYWIQTGTMNTIATHLWVKVPVIPASGTQTFYLYYGNNSAAAASDGDRTFIEYVNFDQDGVISYGAGQDAQASNYDILDNTRTLRMYGNNWKATNAVLTLANNSRIDFSFRNTGTQAEINGIGLDTEINGLNANWFYKAHGTQSWGSYATGPVYSGSGGWEDLEIVLDDFSGNFSYLVFSNDADAGQATNVYYRDVRVRKHSACQPLVSIGAEESIISQMVFATTEQTVIQHKASAVMTVETRNSSGGAVNVTIDTVIELSSTSSGGVFSDSPAFTSTVTRVTIPSGQSSVDFYYRDSIVGTPTIIVSERPARGWADASQTITVLSSVEDFLVEVSSPQIAGEKFGMIITALDDKGAVAISYNEPVTLSVNYVSPNVGNGQLSTTSVASFVNGEATIVNQSYSNCGTINIVVTNDNDPSKTGASGNVFFAPFDYVIHLDDIDATASGGAAGQHAVNKPFTAGITARKADGNACTSYQGPASLTVNDAGPSVFAPGNITPEALAASDWNNGVADIGNVLYDRWGEVTISCRDDTLTTRMATSEPVMFIPEDFQLLLSDPLPSRTFYYMDEVFTLTVRARDYNHEGISNYQGRIDFSGEGLSLPEEYAFTEDDAGQHKFDVVGLEGREEAQVTVHDTAHIDVKGLSDVLSIKRAKIKVFSAQGPIGVLEVEVAVIDDKGDIIVEDDSTLFRIVLSEFFDDDSAESGAEDVQSIMTAGKATVMVSDYQAETVDVTANSVPELDSMTGTIIFGTVSGSGLSIQFHRELKDPE